MPEIYVADLKAYNDGELHGIWIDAAQDVEDIEKEIKEMLKEENTEEWEIHDSEGFGDVDVHGMSLDEISRLAKGIEEHGEAFAAFYMDSEDIDAAETEFQDAYEGEYSSANEFAYEYLNDVFTIPDFLASYIDYEKVTRDLMMDFWSADAPGGRVYIFRWG